MTSNTEIQKDTFKVTSLEEKAPGIFLLTMKHDKITNLLIHEIDVHLDTVEATEGPVALITTSSLRKIYSQGIDFEVFDYNPRELWAFFKALGKLLGRFTTVGFPTIAAINGHCFAGGTIFSMAHDFRVMRNDYGIMCLPEVDIGSDFAPALIKTLEAKMPYPAMQRMTVFGEKIFPKTGVKLKVLDKIVPKDQLIPYSVKLAQQLAPKAIHRKALQEMKRVLYREVHEAGRHRPCGDVECYFYFRDNKNKILAEMGIKQ